MAATDLKERLSQRHEERLQEVEKRRKEKETNEDPAAHLFFTRFDDQKREIESKIESSVSVEKAALSNHFDEITKCIQKLKTFLFDSSLFLPQYDLKRAQEKVDELLSKVTEKQDELMPKKKFGFKSRKKVTSARETAEEDLKETQPQVAETTQAIDLAQLGFTDKQGVNLDMSNTEVTNKDIALARLSQCKLTIRGSPLAVHMNNLTDCTVLCGPVSSAVFIENCTNCKFVLACQQLRVHSTNNSKFYIHVTSRAIIEDCKDIGFAPYNWTYSGLENDYSTSGLNVNENNWSLVNDFNWLKTDEHSPNWHIIPENERGLDSN